jgi:N-acetylmuramoyl-L-alanine amidase
MAAAEPATEPAAPTEGKTAKADSAKTAATPAPETKEPPSKEPAKTAPETASVEKKPEPAPGDSKKDSAPAPALEKPTTRITPPETAAAPAQDPAPKIAEAPPPPSPPEPPPEETATSKAAPLQAAPGAPEEALPAAPGAAWKVAKIDGRDYVTGQSIQRFYAFSQYKMDGRHVWIQSPNLILKAQVGSQELLVNNIKFILSYPVLSQNNEALFSRLDLCKLIEPVIRPSFIGSESSFDTVVLDAGHGGHDAGAKGVYGYEKTYTLALAMTVRDALVKRGFKVVMTRTTDTFPTLASRVALANRTPNSIFVSLHFNSGGSTASGIETFALTPQGSASSLARGGGFSNVARVGNQFDSENIALATAVHAQVVHRFKFIDRGIKRARWNVLAGCNRPGILFEGGFITNARENQLIASDSYRKGVADAIADGIVNYKKALQPRLGAR